MSKCCSLFRFFFSDLARLLSFRFTSLVLLLFLILPLLLIRLFLLVPLLFFSLFGFLVFLELLLGLGPLRDDARAHAFILGTTVQKSGTQTYLRLWVPLLQAAQTSPSPLLAHNASVTVERPGQLTRDCTDCVRITE